jgi:hypothetical protein
MENKVKYIRWYKYVLNLNNDFLQNFISVWIVLVQVRNKVNHLINSLFSRLSECICCFSVLVLLPYNHTGQQGIFFNAVLNPRIILFYNQKIHNSY